MEKECIECKRRFYEEDETLQKCPQCRGAEFAAGQKLSAEERETLALMNSKALKKRKLRANKRVHSMRYAMEFRPSGMLRCVLALVLFALCVFFFMISDGRSKLALAEVSYSGQLLLSLSCAAVSIGLLLPSFKMHKFLISVASAIILTVSALLPTLFQTTGFENYLSDSADATASGAEEDKLRCLKDEDLEYFAKCARDYPDGTHYAIFMRMPNELLKTESGSLKNIALDTHTNDLIKMSLSRLLLSDAVTHHRSKSGISGIGVYFTVCNSQLGDKDISGLLQKYYGKLYYSSQEKRIYELYIDTAKLHKQFDETLLADVAHADFVQRNIEALSALDADVVRAAANRLSGARAHVFSSVQAGEKIELIKSSLRELLAQSWESNPLTYHALMEAMVAYAPGEVVAEDIFALWCKDDAKWKPVAGMMAERIEPLMLRYISRPERAEQEVLSAMSYLRQYGSEAALSALRPYINHSSSALSNMASVAISAIQQRVQQSK